MRKRGRDRFRMVTKIVGVMRNHSYRIIVELLLPYLVFLDSTPSELGVSYRDNMPRF